MNFDIRCASPPDWELEEAAYKCYFCDIIFLSLESMFKHRKYYCPQRRPLPTSSTVTAPTSSDVASSSAELAPPGNSSSQSFESTVAEATSDPESDFDMEISPDREFDEDVAAYLRGEHSYAANLEMAGGGQFPARCAKRKRLSSEHEPASEVGPSSSTKRDNTASVCDPRDLSFMTIAQWEENNR